MFRGIDDGWRTKDVNRDAKHDRLVKKLSGPTGSIFTHFKDLMVFAAMVGYSEKSKSPLGPDKIRISLDTYSNTQQDTFIYLLALLENRDAECLKGENLSEAIKIFEQYCNSGLTIIQGWLDDAPGDPSGLDTITQKVVEKVIQNEAQDQKNQNEVNLVVDFAD